MGWGDFFCELNSPESGDVNSEGFDFGSMDEYAFFHATGGSMILPPLKHLLDLDAVFNPHSSSSLEIPCSLETNGSVTSTPSEVSASSGSSNLQGCSGKTPVKKLKLMNSDKSKLYNVKSHLQKHRILKNVGDSVKGKRVISSGSGQQNIKAERGVLETLRLQLELQRQLQEQLQDQCKMQTKIEEHSKCLRRMLERQKVMTKSLLISQLSSVPVVNGELS